VLLQPIRCDHGALRASVRLEAPPDRVFDHIADLRNMVRWWPEHPVYRRLAGDGGARSLYAWVYKLGPVPILGWSRVLECDPDRRRFDYHVGPPGVGARFTYDIEASGPDATRVDLTMLTPFARLAGFEAQIVPELTRALDRLAEDLRVTGR
jgi:hypothetical protein